MTAALIDPFLPPEASGSAGSATSSGSSGTPLTACNVLDDTRTWLARFVRTMHDRDLDLLTLWATHTHLMGAFYTTPRLLLDSPMPGSGKTTVLEHLERLTYAPVQMASVASPALLTRMLGAGMRTLLIDEADRSLSPDKEGVGELLAVLNSGYKKGATRPTLVPDGNGGWTPQELPTYAPVCMAGNSPRLPDDTRSRTLRVLLLPDLENSVEESDWELIEDEARALGKRLADWADSVSEQVRTDRPPLPDGVTNRARERWNPLKRVAVAAGGRWPDAADDLAREDLARMDQDKEDGMTRQPPAVMLLKDLREVWPTGTAFVTTKALLEALMATAPDAWGPGSTFGKALTAQRLGRMLATAYGLHSDRPDSNGQRGYLLATLNPVFRRMGLTPLPSKPDEVAGPAEPDGAA